MTHTENPETFEGIITDLFVLKDRGIATYGEIISGTLKIGDSVLISGGNKPDVVTQVAGIPIADYAHDDLMARSDADHEKKAKHFSLFFKVDPEQIEIGMTVTTIKQN
ncbi:MAG: hypothetical protein RLP44_00245 [Aggregatilineales bacterium]